MLKLSKMPTPLLSGISASPMKSQSRTPVPTSATGKTTSGFRRPP